MSLQLLSIPNDPDNAYNRTKTRYLKLQKPGKYMVNGKRELYIPNTPYQTFSKTGKQIVVSTADVNVKSTFNVEIS